MYTIRLRLNDKAFKNLVGFLRSFSNDEVQIIRENDEYISVREYLKKELASVEEGSAEYISLEELDKELESAIGEYED